MNSLGPVVPPPAPPGSPPPRPPAIPVAPQTESTGQQSTGANSGGSQATPQQPAAAPAAPPQPSPAVSVSASLAGVLAGATIPAEVIAARPDGQVVVLTPNGTAVAQMPNPPPAGSTLTLQIVSATAADVRAMVVAVDDMAVDPPVPLRLTVTGITAPPAPVDPAAPRPAVPVPVPTPAPLPDPGTVLPARLVAPPAQPLPPAPAGGLPSLPQVMALAGQPLQARIVALTPPPQFVPPVPTSLMPAAAAPAPLAPVSPGGMVAAPAPARAATTATAGAAQQAAPLASAPPAASRVNAVPAIAGASPAVAPGPGTAARRAGPAALAATPGIPPAATPVLAGATPAQPAGQGLIAAVTLNGFVMASTPNQAVIATPAGTLLVETRGTLPPGTQITLAVEPVAVAAGAVTDSDAPASTAPATPRAALLELADGWPALRHALHAAETLNPAAAAAFMNQRLPGLNGRTAANILFFLTALRRGDAGGWLGPELTRTLEGSRERGRLSRLQAEFAQLSQLTDSPAGGDWRVLPFPLFDGQTIDPVFLFYRGKRKGKDGAPKDDLRFLVDVRLSQIGALQFDGLVRGKRFDLVIRSHAPMTPTMREDIGRIFTEALGATGMTGDVVFQTVAPFPVSPFAEMLGEGGRATKA